MAKDAVRQIEAIHPGISGVISERNDFASWVAKPGDMVDADRIQGTSRPSTEHLEQRTAAGPWGRRIECGIDVVQRHVMNAVTLAGVANGTVVVRHVRHGDPSSAVTESVIANGDIRDLTGWTAAGLVFGRQQHGIS